MTDDERLQEFRASMELYQGRTAKDRWLTACSAFLNLRHRVLAKWEGELHQERTPDNGYVLCYYLRNLSVNNHVEMLTLNDPEKWDEITEMCERLVACYADELREFRILMFRVHNTFTPYRKRLTRQQQAQMFRCFDYFEHGEDMSRERNQS
jgi:hypothetical protein